MLEDGVVDAAVVAADDALLRARLVAVRLEVGLLGGAAAIAVASPALSVLTSPPLDRGRGACLETVLPIDFKAFASDWQWVLRSRINLWSSWTRPGWIISSAWALAMLFFRNCGSDSTSKS